jgi:hypothetical protein
LSVFVIKTLFLNLRSKRNHFQSGEIEMHKRRLSSIAVGLLVSLLATDPTLAQTDPSPKLLTVSDLVLNPENRTHEILDIPLVYPDDLAQMGKLQVLLLNRPLQGTVDSDANPRGWMQSTSTAFLVVDEASRNSAYVTSIGYLFDTPATSAQSENLMVRRKSSGTTASGSLVDLVAQVTSGVSVSTIVQDDESVRYNILLRHKATLVDTHIAVGKGHEAYGLRLVDAVLSRYAAGAKTTKTSFSEPSGREGGASREIQPDIWSMRASANNWGLCTDGGGQHTVAVWTNLATNATSDRRFNNSSTGAWSPRWGYISAWGTPCSSSMPWNQYWLGVPDSTWLNWCFMGWACPSQSDRWAIWRYSAQVLYP